MKKTLSLFCLLTIVATVASAQSTSNPDESKPIPKIIGAPPPLPANPINDNGLVGQYIRSIFQDSKGNLWFGTIGQGVAKYDEKTLEYYSWFNGYSVHAIAEDKKGNMWFGTDQGVVRYDGKAFKNYTRLNGLTNVNVGRKSILIDRLGNIWVGTSSGVFRYNPGTDNFLLFDVFPLISVRDIMEDRTGNIWFATGDQGVFRYDGQTIKNIQEKEGLGDNYAGGMIQDKQGNFWFVMKRGICRYDGKTFTEITSKDGLGGSEFWGICLETSGIIWITARGSTTRYDPSIPISDPKAFTVFTVADGLNCCVQSMYQDRSGNMWWGAGSGLYRFNGKQFYQVKQTGPW